MSTLNTDPKAPPVFLTGNMLTRHADRESDLTVSSGVALRHRLYDMDPASLWAGENDDDGVNEAVIFGLWLPGMQSSQDLDFLAVLNHNLATFDWDLSDDNGSSYPGANQQVITGQTASDHIRSLSAVIAADKVQMTMHTTQTADAFKQVGGLVVARALLQAPIGMSLFRKHPARVQDRSAKMHDNSTRRSYVYRSDASLKFQDFSVGFKGLSEDEADEMEAVLLGPDPIIFYPEPGDRPGKMYQGQVVPGTFDRNYCTLSRSGGEMITFDFEETGGA